LNGGYGWLEIEMLPMQDKASLPLGAIRKARDTPIWELELCSDVGPVAHVVTSRRFAHGQVD
jgi:hypothetical protein